MQGILQSKIFLGIILLFLLGTLGYRLFSPSALPTDDETALTAGKDLIEISDQLSRAQLSQNLFTMPGYLILTDFTAVIPQQSYGRTNPFEVIGRD